MFTRSNRILTLALSIIIVTLALTGAAFFQETAESEAGSPFTEKFSNDFWDRWESNVLIGNPNGNYLNLGRKRLMFTLPQTEAHVIVTTSDASYEDVKVEATFENIRSNEASYAVLCRYSEDGWYEFRISVAGPEAGSYKLMKFDPYLKNQFKNPYVVLHPGMDRFFTNDIKLGLNMRNTLALICKADEFQIFINDKQQTPTKNGSFTDNYFTEGSVGYSVQTYGKGLSDIDVTKFSVEAP
jgi:hypothetical protein